MKLLTFAIPCYNSQDYMENCIKSLLPGGDDVEILIIDDGSKDSTGDIADAYEKKYPGIIRAIHQVMEDTERLSMLESAMRQDFILKW